MQYCHLLERCEEVGGQAEEGPGQPTAQDHLEGGDSIGSVGKACIHTRDWKCRKKMKFMTQFNEKYKIPAMERIK